MNNTDLTIHPPYTGGEPWYSYVLVMILVMIPLINYSLGVKH
jgi:hypothetical protein